MPVTDVKSSLRKRGPTNFGTDGKRILLVTSVDYIEGLKGPDGRLHPDLHPAELWSGRQYVGIANMCLLDTEMEGKMTSHSH
jgi:hypothetical protein